MIDRRRQRFHVLLVTLPELVEEVVAQQRNILGALAQRRHTQRNGVDPEVQIFPQPAFTQRGIQVDIGRADEAEVDVHDAIAANRPVLALLQNAQELGLEIRRHLADLVEQQRAPLGHLEEAFLVQRRARERALLVAEELRLDQIFGDRRAVDLDERPLRPLAVVVDGVGDQFLARAVLALDEDVRLARRDALDELEQILHLLALADDVVEPVPIVQPLFQLLVLVEERLLLDGLLELVEQAFGVDRLLQEIERAGLDRLDGPRDVALAGDDDDFRFRIELLELAHELDPVDVGEHHIGDDRVGTPRLEEFLAPSADQCSSDVEARVLEQDLQPLGHRRFVVYRENTLLPFNTHEAENVSKTRNKSKH